MRMRDGDWPPSRGSWCITAPPVPKASNTRWAFEIHECQTVSMEIERVCDLRHSQSMKREISSRIRRASAASLPPRRSDDGHRAMWSNVELVRERMQGPPVSTEVRSLIPMVSGYDAARANQTDTPIRHLSV